jgi:peptidoglycan hydrolase-like protein with peptidoglycan-binding domain
MAVISRHDLERYDSSEPIPFGNPYTLTDDVIRQGSKGESVKWLQWELDSKGYPLNVDGIYGPKTEAAVRQFQTDVFVDGIAGEITLKKLS